MKYMLERQFMTSEPLCVRGRAAKCSILVISLQLEYDLPLLSLQEGILRFSYSIFFFLSPFFFNPLGNREVRLHAV